MEKNEIIRITSEYVKEKLSKDTSGHDWWHTYRVWKAAVEIARREKADIFIVELAALLHDIADHKMHNGDYNAGAKKAREWLESLKVDNETIEKVTDIVANVSFSKGNIPKSNEGKIVQDADRLDALGAIGIARAFAYGGKIGKEMHNPNIKPNGENTTSINHFYDKLLKLKDKMNTVAGKKLAEERYKFLEEYLRRFYDEWEAKI